LGILPRHCSLPDGTPPPQIDRPPPAHVDAILNQYGAEGYRSASNIRTCALQQRFALVRSRFVKFRLPPLRSRPCLHAAWEARAGCRRMLRPRAELLQIEYSRRSFPSASSSRPPPPRQKELRSRRNGTDAHHHDRC
jgi:hypothetical protein